MVYRYIGQKSPTKVYLCENRNGLYDIACEYRSGLEVIATDIRQASALEFAEKLTKQKLKMMEAKPNIRYC